MKKIFLIVVIVVSITRAYSQSEDELSIKALLKKESATWRAGDIKGHADCWMIQPYSRILVSTGDGVALDISPTLMISPPLNMVGKGGSSTNTNYKMNITGMNAWVNHDEESTSEDGSKNYTYEFRILEKIKGQWKLVGQSIHVYKPK